MTPFPRTAKRRRDDTWWRALAFLVGLPLVLVLALAAVSAASDGGRVPSELAAAARETGVMLCSEGRIDHGDGAWFDRLFDSGKFRCTAWRMRQRLVDSNTGATVWPTSPRR
jgi:hypothetical protein